MEKTRMATAKKPVRKTAKKSFSFVVMITDVNGDLIPSVSEVTGTLKDELNVREYLEAQANTYFTFLDSLDVEGDVDEDYEDDE